MELFFPDAALHYFGLYVWLMMFSLYLLVLLLVGMLQRPRIVVYGAQFDQVRGELDEVLRGLDEAVEWSGAVCRLPSLGVQFEADESPGMRVLQLIATRSPQSVDGWIRLLEAVRQRLAVVRTARAQMAGGWLAAGLVVLLLAVYWLLVSDQPLDAQLRDMLRLPPDWWG